MSRSSWCPSMPAPAAVVLLLVALAAAMATAAAAIEPQDEQPLLHERPLHEEPQDNKRALLLDELVDAARAQQLMPQIKEEPAAQMAWAEALTAVQTAEKKDGGARASLPASESGTKPAMAAISIQGGDPGSVPAASGGNGKESGEHGKEEGNGGSSKEGEKSASSGAGAGAGKSCLSKEECHKKRLLCGKGCTLSAHAKCAAKCSKSCVPTC